ncbi:hypothetical protein L3V82_01510 [Thiotrichales bacterium 19S3-7]|nr:hypothetical protein [Thiotrichales bacterium 19S3-7]MCF6800840.1 hypothetical protein [Thiotrichales bacterium 19S3-11]
MKAFIYKVLFILPLLAILSACSNDDNQSVSDQFKSASNDVVSASKKAANATSQAATSTWDKTKEAANDVNENN